MHYNNAPIVEAVIDLRVIPQSGISAVEIAAGLTEIRAAFPDRQEIPADARLQFNFGSHLPPSVGVSPALRGFRYVSVDKRRIFQAHVDGFTFSLMSPYDTWAAFKKEAQHLWETYFAVCRPSLIERVAVRYVNRFDLPGPLVVLKDYFNTYPQEPIQLPYHDFSNYACHLQVPQPDIQGMLILNQAAAAPVKPETVAVILDIDLFREAPAWNADDGETIWRYMEVLHRRKNEVFEACITENAREVIR